MKYLTVRLNFRNTKLLEHLKQLCNPVSSCFHIIRVFNFFFISVTMATQNGTLFGFLYRMIKLEFTPESMTHVVQTLVLLRLGKCILLPENRKKAYLLCLKISRAR